MCRRAVREWLVLLTMEKYIGKFLERGYDSIANSSEDDNPLFGPMDSPKAARRALDHEFDDLDLGEDFHLPLDSITFEKLSDEDDPLPVIMSD
ncbi:uncharacterized protein LOC108031273 isoform X2 [Drosophila biarmipes]|uniref:uncharacterized protein LOC108031273 isoform X2 n=1 Tax=Drosophila biarmipes TaxID=125945 RepID=UPI0021CD0570|nr:uncharacterized protein LOC108031273 isoform X2 [Drosophila biarmipes]